MILVIPVQRVSDEEVLYLILTVIKDLRAPVRMLTLPRVGILIGRGTVEIRQSLRILREVCRYPVEDHADAMLVKIIHQVHELPRRAMTARRCEIAGHLISPAGVKRMLCDSHQLHVGVAHIVTVLRELMCRLRIGIEAVFLLAVLLPPGAEMTLINRHRLCEGRRLRARTHPALVSPAIPREIRGHRCRTRTELCGKCIRICLIQDVATLCMNRKLVDLTEAHALDEALVDAAGLERKHIVRLHIPRVPVTDDGNGLRMRCPDRKVHTLLSVQRRRVRTHLLINLIITALAEEVAIELGDEDRVQCFRRSARHRPLLLFLRCTLVCRRRNRFRGLPRVLFYRGFLCIACGRFCTSGRFCFPGSGGHDVLRLYFVVIILYNKTRGFSPRFDIFTILYNGVY